MWVLVATGCAVLLSGFDQPLTLLIVASSLNGVVTAIYSVLLIPAQHARAAAGHPAAGPSGSSS